MKNCIKKTVVDWKKYATLLFQLHIANCKLHMGPSSILCILYIFSGVDVIPEAVVPYWISYLDDAMVLLLNLVYIYYGRRGARSRNVSEVDERENVYAHIIRNSDKHINNYNEFKTVNNHTDDDCAVSNVDIHNTVNSVEKQGYGEFKIDALLDELQCAEKESHKDKPSKEGETGGKDSQTFSVFYDPKPKRTNANELAELFQQEHRADKFELEPDEIIW